MIILDVDVATAVDHQEQLGAKYYIIKLSVLSDITPKYC